MFCIFESGRNLEVETALHNPLLPNGKPFLPFGKALKKYFAGALFQSA
jgi:hypothetical protein